MQGLRKELAKTLGYASVDTLPGFVAGLGEWAHYWSAYGRYGRMNYTDYCRWIAKLRYTGGTETE
jgi:hypothetical protein